MKEEMQSLTENKTWKLVLKPKNHRIAQCTWIFKLKEGNNPIDPLRHKASLIAKGFAQKEGINYNKTFFSVIKYKTIRLVLALVAHFN